MSAKGYSLVEMLAVLAILSLMIAISGAYLVRHGKPFAMRTAVLDLASCLRKARDSAIEENRQRTVVLDLDSRRYVCPKGAGDFPPNSRLLFQTVASEYIKERTAAMRFFADGTGTGGHVFLEDQGQIWAVRVNWLTGNVETSRETKWPEQ
jgi:general secretion pathway protein H